MPFLRFDQRNLFNFSTRYYVRVIALNSVCGLSHEVTQKIL